MLERNYLFTFWIFLVKKMGPTRPIVWIGRNGLGTDTAGVEVSHIGSFHGDAIGAKFNGRKEKPIHISIKIIEINPNIIDISFKSLL